MSVCMRIVAMCVVALVVVPELAQAQTSKIGYVDVRRLMSESPQAKAAMEALQEEFAPRQREIVAQQTGLSEKESTIERDMEVMGPDERQNAERDLRKVQREIARSQEEITEDFNLRRNEELGRLQRELMQQVQSFARESGFDLIVGDGVLYASSGVDVTQKILSGLESSFSAPAAP
jgi:outer membrane protein